MPRTSLAAALVAVSVASLASTAWAKETRETVHHTFSKDKTLEVRNQNGTIDIMGDGGSTIRVDAERITRAADDRMLDRARQDVKLDMADSGGVARVEVEYPHGRHGFFDFFDAFDYEVTYNFIIHVPKETALQLHTVNGAIKSSQTSGSFEIHAVNGHVTLSGIAGSGSVSTVNGGAEVSFREAPKAACEFHSVNGRLDVTLPANLSADFTYHTVHGGVFTDFDTSSPDVPAAGRRESFFNYRGGGRARVGSGGPELSFHTVNGEIRIHKQAK
jgi:hypothetical protein